MSAHAIAGLGHNNGPVDPNFIDERLMQRALEITHFIFRNDVAAARMLRIMVKRCNDDLVTALRWCVGYAVEKSGMVTRDGQAKFWRINTKTMGEDYKRPERWAEHDDELADDLERYAQTTIGYMGLNTERLLERVADWKDKDPLLRKEEKRERLEELAAECRDAAERHDEAGAKLLKRSSAKTVAKALPDAGVAALEIVARLAAHPRKMRRALTSELNAAGLAQCKLAGLLFDAEPHGSLAKDPQIGLTEKGGKVYLECVALDRCGKGKV